MEWSLTLVVRVIVLLIAVLVITLIIMSLFKGSTAKVGELFDFIKIFMPSAK